MQPALRRKLLLTRSLLALVFWGAGLTHLLHYADTLGSLRAQGVWASTLVLPLAILIEWGGGTALALGWRPRLASYSLALYLVSATWLYHDFWNSTGAERSQQLSQFLKNLSILGGVLTYGVQSQVLHSFLGGTLVQLRRESFERRRVA